MEMFLNDYLPNEIRKVIGLIENNLDLVLNKAFNSKSLNDITDYIYKLTN